MQPKNNPILLIGVGNYLMGDEGLGVHAVERWSSMHAAGAAGAFPVDVLDGGTGGFHLLEYFERYSTVILVDATLDGQPPGTMRLIRPRFATDLPPAMSTHDIGLKDLIGALQLLDKMPDLYLFVVSVASIQQQGTRLTAPIEAAMPELLTRIEALAGLLRVAGWREAQPIVARGQLR